MRCLPDRFVIDNNRRLTNLGKNIEFCLPLLPSVTTLQPSFCTNGKYKACSVAWREHYIIMIYGKTDISFVFGPVCIIVNDMDS